MYDVNTEGMLDFYTLVTAKIQCNSGQGCEGCIIRGDLCATHGLDEETVKWMKLVSNRLEQIDKKFEETTDEEFLSLIEDP